MIRLDASAASTLDWSLERKEALKLIASGKKVLWHLDLGLFDRLKMPLSNPSQFKTLGLAVDYFRDTIWKEFHAFSSGVCLYQGIPIASESAEYLKMLAERIPDDIPIYLEYTSLPEDPLERALVTNPERFGRILIRAPYSWRTDEEVKIGILMPPLDVVSHLEPFRKAIQDNPSAKLIPEERLTASWEGLQLLLYSEKCLSNQGRRKIQGFIAAGGEVQDLTA